MAANDKADKPGPNPATAIVAKDVDMQYITSKEENNKHEDELLDKLKELSAKNAVKCRTCSGDHWTSRCPSKDIILAGGKIPDQKKKPTTGVPSAGPATSKAGRSKYVAPRDRGVNKYANGIRITNISESTTNADLSDFVKDFVKPSGPIKKLYLAKDRQTGLCKGFAYINFMFRNDAAKAISLLDGHDYNQHILTVDWSRPELQQL